MSGAIFLFLYLGLILKISNVDAANKLVDDLIRQAERDYQTGAYEKAVEKMKVAIDKDATNPEIYLVLGHCHWMLADIEEAIKNYEKCADIARNSKGGECLLWSGNAYNKIRKPEKALKAFERAASEFGNSDARTKLSESYISSGQYAMALEANLMDIRRNALKEHDLKLLQIGKILLAAEEYELSLLAFKLCYQLHKDTEANAHFYAGYALELLGKEELALEQFEIAENNNELANSEAIDYFKNIAILEEENKKLASALKSDVKFMAYSQEKLTDMVLLVLDSIRLKTSYLVHADNMCFFEKFQDQSEFDTLANDFYDTLLSEWNTKNLLRTHEPDMPVAASSFAPFHGIQVPFNISLTKLIATSFSRHFFGEREQFSHTLSKWKPMAEQRLRVGFMTTDIRRHPMFQVMRGIWQYYDRSKYEIYIYPSKRSSQEQFDQVLGWVDKVNSQFESMSTKQRMNTVYKDKIQVLVDLNVHTMGKAREVLPQKPAPIQVSFGGYPGTSGMDSLDYIIADERAIPEYLSSEYSESIIYLPQTWLLNSHATVHADIMEKYDVNRAHFKLPVDAFVFANFGRPFKIDGDIFDTWCSILKRVPNSVLWLINHHDSDFEKFARHNFRLIMKHHNIDPARLVVTPKIDDGRHIAAATLADIFLDTPKYNGGMTSVDTLWSGVPLITMPGKQSKMTQRMGLSLCHALGMPEMVVTSHSEYEERAVSLALDNDALDKLRHRLQEAKKRKPGLFDTIGGANTFMEGLRMTWARFMDGKDAGNIHVPDSKHKKHKNNQRKNNRRAKKKNNRKRKRFRRRTEL